MKVLLPRLFALAALLHFATFACAQGQASADAVLAPVRERTQIPGLAAAVVRDGKIIAVGVAGVRELGQPELVQPGDPFLVASCTKLMTQLLVGRLVQDGRLRLDATMAQLLPGVKLRPEYAKATLGDLLGHTAGLPAYTRITPHDTPIIFELKGSPKQQRDTFVAHVVQENPAGAVGSDFVYSNAGFVALGNIAECAAGKPWESLIQEQVFQPLGVRSATVGFPGGAAANALPKGHARTPNGFAPAKYEPPNAGVFAPAGGICLAIEDFARLAAAEVSLEAGRETAFLNQATANAVSAQAAKRAPRGESRVYFGGQGSFTAACAVWPAQGLGIVVCTNGGDSDEVCLAAVEALRAAFAPDVPPQSAGGGPNSGPKLGVRLRAEAGGPVFFDEVAPGGLADKLGIKSGDEIVSIDGKAIGAPEPAVLSAALRVPGARLELRRDGKIVEIRLPGGAPPAAPAPK